MACSTQRQNPPSAAIKAIGEREGGRFVRGWSGPGRRFASSWTAQQSLTCAGRRAGTRWTNEQLLFHMLFGYLIVRALLVPGRIFSRLPDGASKAFTRLLDVTCPAAGRRAGNGVGDIRRAQWLCAESCAARK